MELNRKNKTSVMMILLETAHPSRNTNGQTQLPIYKCHLYALNNYQVP